MLARLLAAYPWFEHPEGIKFAEIERDEHRSVGLWLILPGRFSAFHRVTNGAEVWAVHAGSVRLHLLGLNGECECVQLGVNTGERPVASVPAGWWQAAELPAEASYAFGSNICAPGFQYSAFEVGQRDALCRTYPRHASLIQRLTHG